MRVGRIDRVHQAAERSLEDGTEGRFPRSSCSSSHSASSEPLGSPESARAFRRRTARRRGRRGILGSFRCVSLCDGSLGRLGAVEDLLEERVGRRGQQFEVLVRDRVTVLLEEAVGLVRDIKSIVSDREPVVAEPRLLEDLGGFGLGPDRRVQLLDKVGVGPGGHARFLVEEREDTKFALDEVDRRLVVRVIDELPVDLLADVLLLLELEHVRVELQQRRAGQVASCWHHTNGKVRAHLLLQLLVRIVDAELLKAVLLEVFEPVNVLREWANTRTSATLSKSSYAKERGATTHEDSDKVLDGAFDAFVGQALVDDGDEPLEQARIDVLGNRVLDDVGLCGVQARDNLVGPGHDLLLEDPPLELGRFDPEQLCRED